MLIAISQRRSITIEHKKKLDFKANSSETKLPQNYLQNFVLLILFFSQMIISSIIFQMFKSEQNLQPSSIISVRPSSISPNNSSISERPIQNNQKYSTSNHLLDYEDDQASLSPSSDLSDQEYNNGQFDHLESQDTIMNPPSNNQWPKTDNQQNQPSIKCIFNTTDIKEPGTDQKINRNMSSLQRQAIEKEEPMNIYRMNYKMMIRQEIQRNRGLQEKLDRQIQRVLDSRELIEKLKEQNKLLLKMLKKQKQSTQKNKSSILKIGKDIAQIKKSNKINQEKSAIVQKSYDFSRKQRKRLQEENQRYKIFVNGLCKSMGLLTGRKVQGMTKLWEEWTKVFKEVNGYRTHANIFP